MIVKTKVFIADDNHDFQSLLAESFSFHDDFEVIGTAFGGYDAFEKITLLRPDVVILDILMPQIDGIGVMKKLSESDMYPKPVVIAMSCFVNDNIISDLTQHGAQYFMVKPFDPDILIDRIRQFINYKSFTGFINQDRAIEFKPSLDVCIVYLLNELRIPTKLSGFYYIKDALILSYNDNSIIKSITKLLYPEIAKKNKTTSSRVERSIRHAIEMAFNESSEGVFKEIFGNNMTIRPTNSHFIAALCERLRTKHT